MPLVSAIIPTYNRASFIAEAVESVLAQTYQAVEAIVVDDGSTDDTASIMQPIVRSAGGRVTYVRQKNAGVSAARDSGISLAKGEFLALLDSDDRWLPRKLELQMPLFAEAGVGLVHGGIRCFDQETGATLTEYFPAGPIDFHALLAHRYLGTQTLVFRKSLALKVGAFDPEMQPAEDWEYTLRLATHCQVRGVAETLAEIRIHDSQLSGDKEKLARASLAVLAKHEHIHGNCAACRAACRTSRDEYRMMLYRDFNRRARLAASRMQPLACVSLAARAVCQDPWAILRKLHARSKRLMLKV